MEDKKYKEIVEEVLKEFPKTRDNDFLLIMHVFLKLGFAKRIPLGINISYENIEFAPSFETISRIRRFIQNTEGRFPPSKEADTSRRRKEEEFREEYSRNHNPREMQDLNNYNTIRSNSWMS